MEHPEFFFSFTNHGSRPTVLVPPEVASMKITGVHPVPSRGRAADAMGWPGLSLGGNIQQLVLVLTSRFPTARERTALHPKELGYFLLANAVRKGNLEVFLASVLCQRLSAIGDGGEVAVRKDGPAISRGHPSFWKQVSRCTVFDSSSQDTVCKTLMRR
jgi:hypothetical protein